MNKKIKITAIQEPAIRYITTDHSVDVKQMEKNLKIQ